MTVRELVEASGLTQRDFAESFGIPLRTLENWVEGKRNPPPYIITMLQKLLDK